MSSDASNVTRLLVESGSDEPDNVVARLAPLVYDELRSLARRYFGSEPRDHTLQPTALVHEAFLRLVDETQIDWQGRTHFYAACAGAMRHILVDHARGRRRLKRGGGWYRLTLEDAEARLGVEDVDVLDFNDTLERLASLSKRQAQVVELRFFAGMAIKDIAMFLGVSKRTVEGDWTHAKAWLRSELSAE